MDKHLSLLCIVFFVFLINSLIPTTKSKLIYVLEISRHGAKYPSKNMTPPVDAVSLKGQLTGVGMRQHYLLGTFLNQDYIKNE